MHRSLLLLLLLHLLLLAGCGAAQRGSSTEGAAVSREQARLERHLEREPDDAERRVRLAQIRLLEGDPDAALAHATHALRSRPGHVGALRVQLDAAALRGDASQWATAWTALGSPADAIPDAQDPAAPATFAASLRINVDGAGAMLSRWSGEPGADALIADLIAQTDRRLFQLYYAGDFAQGRRLLELAVAATGERFVWHKHAVAAAFESRAREAAQVLLRVSGGEPDVIHALAAEFDGRSAHRAASGCWQALAEAVEGEERASALLAAADAEYALGARAQGRRLAGQALATAGASAELPARLWRVLERRRDAEQAVVLLTAHADAIPCTGDDVRRSRLAEDTLAEAALAVDPSPESAAMIRERALQRAATCVDPGFARDAGLRMVAAFRYAEAVPLLQRYASAYPGDAEVVPSLVSALEWAGDTSGAGLAAQAFVEARLAADPEPDDAAARAVLDVLRAGSSDPVTGVRADFLAAVAERAPALRATSLAWATELERLGLRAERIQLLQRFVTANGDTIESRFWVAFWMADNVADAEESVAALRELAQTPGASQVSAPILHRGAWNVAEAAWLRMFDLAPHVAGADAAAREAVLGFAEARGTDRVETWRDVWAGQLIAGWISPSVRIELLDRMLGAGFAEPAVLSALGVACYESGQADRAVGAWSQALLADASAMPRVLADIERVGALSLALQVLESSGVDDGSPRTARMRLEVRLALAAEPVGPWETHVRRIALQRAVEECLARSCPIEAADAAQLDRIGLPGAALAARRQRLIAGWEPDDAGALDLLGNLLDLHASADELAPWVDRLAHTADADLARTARDRLSLGARPTEAARLARVELALRAVDGRAGLDALTGAASWFGQLATERDLLAFVDELLVGPATALLDPGRSPPAGFEFSGDRRRDGAELLTLAASTLLTRGFAARARELAEQALVEDPDVAGRLWLACGALVEADSRAATPESLEHLVGLAGGGLEDFEEAASAMMARGEPALAVGLLERALLSAPDDLALRSSLAAALVEAGRAAEAGSAAGRVIAAAPAGRAGEEWHDEIRASVVEPLRRRGYHDLAEQIELSALQQRPADAREVAVAAAEVARGAVDAARRRVDRVVARGGSSPAGILALFDAGFETVALELYVRSANRLNVFQHFDLRVPVGLGWARRHGVAAYVELLRDSARSRSEMEIRPWLVEELGYNGMTREAASWLAGTAESLAPAELLMAVAYDLALGEFDRAERATERLIGLTDPEVPWRALLELWEGRGAGDRLDGLAERVMGPGPLPAQLALRHLLRGDPSAALARADVGGADDRLLLARGLAELGYGAEALSLLGAPSAPTAEVGRTLLGVEGATHRLPVVPATDVAQLQLVVRDGVVSDGAAVPPAAVAARVRMGLAPPPAVPPEGTNALELAREFARVGLFGEAVRMEDAAAAAGSAVRAEDLERVRWRHLAGDADGALRELASLPDSRRRQVAARELLRGLDLLLDGELAVALAAHLGGVRGEADDAHRLLAALHALGRIDAAWELETERLSLSDGHPAEVASLLRTYRTWGLTEAGVSLAERAAPGPRASAELWSEVALARAAAGDEPGAIDAIDAGLLLEPDAWSYLQGLAEPLLEVGAWRAVEMVARQGLELEPDGVELTVLRAFARLRSGELEAGDGDLVVATSRPDVNPYWMVRAVEELVRAGLPGAAERLVTRLDGVVWGTASSMRMLEAPSTWSASALLEWAALDPAGARAAAERLAPGLLLRPEYARSETVAARVWEGLDAPEAAADVYRRRLVLAPDDPVLLNNLAYVHAVTGVSLPEAEQLALRSLALAPEASGSTLDTLGWVHFGQGRLAEARALTELALRLEAAQVPAARWLRARGELAEHLARIVEAEARAAAAAPTEERRESRRGRRRE